MHLLQTSSTHLDDLVEPIDLAQPPGDIVVLSFTDSDLAGLAAAYAAERDKLPSVRLAHLRDLRHPMSIDLWIDKVGAARQGDRGQAAWRARLVALRRRCALVDRARTQHRACRAARRGPRRRSSRPGFDAVARLNLRTLLAFFREGGRDNMRALLRHLACHAGLKLEASAPKAVPRMAGYLPGKGAITLDRLQIALAAGKPVVPIVFYRAALLAADTAPIDALCAALAARGLSPAPLFVPSLKDADAIAFIGDALRRLAPTVIVTTTAFAAGGAGDASALDAVERAGAASGDRHHAPRGLARERARSRPRRPRHACGPARA